MTISKDKMLKITMLVDDEQVGGMLVKSINYDVYSELVSSLQNNNPITVVEIPSGNPIFRVGTTFDENTNSFSGDESDIQSVNNTPGLHVFALISNSKVVYVHQLTSPTFDGMIAAYQSNPTFTIEELDNGRFQ